MVIALLKVERFKEAVIAAKESVKQCPGQSRTFLLIAHATSRYPEENGKLRERAKLNFKDINTPTSHQDFYLKALSLDPSCEEAVCNVCNIFIREGKAKDGLEYIKTFLEHNSTYRAHTSAGECYLSLRQHEKAHQHFSIALELNMGYTRAMSGLQFLENNDYTENEFVPANLQTNWSSVS
eukprot:sb/3471657/